MIDRKRHLYVIGQTGTGKSTYLENLIDHDLLLGRGLAVIDPHGQLAEKALSLISSLRRDDLYYIDPLSDRPVAYNPLSGIHLGQRDRVADNIVAAFKHVYSDSWGPQMEWIFVMAVRLVLDHSGTLLDVRRVLLDERYRSRLLGTATSPICVSFWRDEFAQYLTRPGDPTTPILNKLGRVLASPYVRDILCQKQSTLDLRRRMDEERILIVNLRKGEIGEQNAHLLGALIVSGIANAAFSRSDIEEEDRAPFYLYADEFQNFATESFGHVLSEARKYGLSLTLAHQYLDQLPEPLKHAVLGNVGNTVVFRVGSKDAKEMEKHIGMHADTLSSLKNFTAYLQHLKEGSPTTTFLDDLPPSPEGTGIDTGKLLANAYAKFGRPRAKVAEQIGKALAAIAQAPLRSRRGRKDRSQGQGSRFF
jgi:type IV secretory pathway TraG/TraD family ATPase VirD4